MLANSKGHKNTRSPLSRSSIASRSPLPLESSHRRTPANSLTTSASGLRRTDAGCGTSARASLSPLIDTASFDSSGSGSPQYYRIALSESTLGELGASLRFTRLDMQTIGTNVW